jgi:hypothetical protein
MRAAGMLLVLTDQNALDRREVTETEELLDDMMDNSDSEYEQRGRR